MFLPPVSTVARVLVAFAAAWLVLDAHCLAQTPGAALQSEIAAENYSQARALAERILQSGAPADKQAAQVLWGRILLAEGKRVEARKHLMLLRGLKLNDNDKQMLVVYQAWLDALEGNPDGAIKALQEILRTQPNLESTADAAEVLARIHVSRGEKELAVNAVAFGRRFLKYQDLRSGYLEGLFQRILAQAEGIGADPAERLFRQAESLQTAQKFAEALSLYEQIRRDHPKSDWSHPAGFQRGRCLWSLARRTEAEKVWEQFVAEDATGPWRGQARLALIDACLESRLDLAAAAAQAKVALAALEGTLGPKAKPSWEATARDLLLRHGVIALVQGDARGATGSLQKARDGAQAGRAGIEELIVWAKREAPFVPAEVRGAERPATAVQLALAFNVLAEHQKAQDFLAPIQAGQLKGAGPVRAFAQFLHGWAEEGLGRPVLARQDYLASLSNLPAGSWHDETLYRLAMLVERQAAEAFAKAKPETPSKNADPKGLDPKPLSRESDEQRKLRQARTEALAYWQRIPQSFPSSPRVEPALFHMGVLQAEVKLWPPALKSLERLIQEHPLGPWTGDACVRAIDIRLEQMLEPEAARAACQTGEAWLEKSAPQREPIPFDQRPHRDVAYDLWLRAGLLAYIERDAVQAASKFERAKTFSRAPAIPYALGEAPDGLGQLIAVAREGKRLTPEEALIGCPRTATALLLADVYFSAQDYERSAALCERVIQREFPKAEPSQLSWALFKRGRSRFCLEDEDRDPAGAYQDYLAAARTAPKAAWADRAVFLAANVRFNFNEDAPAAIELWRQLIREFPQSREAHRAAYYIGVAYELEGKTTAAKTAYEAFLKDFPNSPFVKLVREHHLPKLQAAQETKGNSKSETKTIDKADATGSK